MFFDYGQAEFRYTPFPIGIAKPVMPDARYAELVANFPPVELFESFEQMGKKGRKFTLSPKENKKRYDDFVQGNPLWREFHQWIKSRDFVYGALEMLAGASHRSRLPLRAARAARLVRQAKSLLRGRRAPGYVPLEARFEFSALPADGGNLPPHTDAPTKIVTMIVSILEDGEWDEAIGGGTDVNWPKDDDQDLQSDEPGRRLRRDGGAATPTRSRPTSAWCSSRPSIPGIRWRRCTGPPGKLRRTLTINIEALA